MALCSICNKTELRHVSSASVLVGTCWNCRDNQGYTDCRHCYNQTIPPGKMDSDCLFCSNPSSTSHIQWVALYGRKATTAIAVITNKRKYIDECPCGIHPSGCDYHRDM